MRTLHRILVVILLLAAGCTRPQPLTLRVLSYNTHHAQGLDGRIDLERIARVVRESGADLVAFQEVDRTVQRSGRVDQPARFGELTAMTPIFEKNIDLQGGQYGNAILSRLPVESYRHHLLPRRGQNEPRGLLEARLRIAGQPLLFLATHLDHQRDDAERMDCAAAIRRLIDQRPGQPVILAGDFNAAPDSPVLREFGSFLLDSCPPDLAGAFTFPADRPDRRIDYILYARDPRLRLLDYRILLEPVASDHRPILATFLLQQESASGWPTSSGRGFAISSTHDASTDSTSMSRPAPRITIDRIAPADNPELPSVLQRVDYTSHPDGHKDWALMLPSKKPTWIVFIHGHGSNGDQLFTRPHLREAWLPVFQADHGVLSVNLRGNAWMSPDAAEDLHALLQEMRANYAPRRFLFVGASMGGTSTLIYAVLHPEDVSGVVALCPAADLATYHQWCTEHRETQILDEIRQAIETAYQGRPDKRPETYREHSALARVDRLTMPVYVAHGSADAIIPVAQSRALAKAAGNRATFHYQELKGGDHEAPLQHMKEALAWVLSHFN